MASTTTGNRAVAAVRKKLLEEIRKLQDAVKDDNALMAGNPILASLQALETLRTEYAETAWTAHTAFIAAQDYTVANPIPASAQPMPASYGGPYLR
jgi:hypothetical protein